MERYREDAHGTALRPSQKAFCFSMADTHRMNNHWVHNSNLKRRIISTNSLQSKFHSCSHEYIPLGQCLSQELEKVRRMCHHAEKGEKGDRDTSNVERTLIGLLHLIIILKLANQFAWLPCTVNCLS